MFVILVYDVDARRDSKVLKICRQYLNHMQNSVFEGHITEAKLKSLCDELKNIMIPESDSCLIYQMSSTKYCRKIAYGSVSFQSGDIIDDNPLII